MSGMKRIASKIDCGATEPKRSKAPTKEPVVCRLMRRGLTEIDSATIAVPGECQVRGAVNRHYLGWRIFGNLPTYIIGGDALQLSPLSHCHLWKSCAKVDRLINARTMHAAFGLPSAEVVAIERQEISTEYYRLLFQMRIQPHVKSTWILPLKTAAMTDPYVTMYATKAPRTSLEMCASFEHDMRRVRVEHDRTSGRQGEGGEHCALETGTNRFCLKRKQIPLCNTTCTTQW